MRNLILTAALLSLASAAAAQSLPKATILADYERTRTNVLAYVNAAPDSMMGFRPTPGVRTFAEQIDHLVSSCVDVAAMSVRGLDRPPVIGDSTRFLHDKAALRAYVTAAYDYTIAAIRDATPAQLDRVSSIYNQPAAPAWRWLMLAHEHAIWTFGQIVPYLRLNRVAPPSYSMPF